MKTDHQAMCDAIELIRDIDDWCQGAGERISNGVVQFCAEGALTVATLATTVDMCANTQRARQFNRLRIAVQNEIHEQGYYHASLPHFNDRQTPGRQQVHEEVIQVM